MPLVTFDDRDVNEDFLNKISHVSQSTTASGESSQTHYFDITGSGYVVVTASVRTDTTSSYGSTMITIWHNGTAVGYGYNRWGSSLNQRQGGSATVTLKVSNGDTIQMQIEQTKGGSKTHWWSCLCFGCTASYR